MSDIFEIAVIISACFIVNYVTSDAKTNWAEGYGMVAFYVMIVRIASVFEVWILIHMLGLMLVVLRRTRNIGVVQWTLRLRRAGSSRTRSTLILLIHEDIL